MVNLKPHEIDLLIEMAKNYCLFLETEISNTSGVIQTYPDDLEVAYSLKLLADYKDKLGLLSKVFTLLLKGDQLNRFDVWVMSVNSDIQSFKVDLESKKKEVYEI